MSQHALFSVEGRLHALYTFIHSFISPPSSSSSFSLLSMSGMPDKKQKQIDQTRTLQSHCCELANAELWLKGCWQGQNSKRGEGASAGDSRSGEREEDSRRGERG